MICSNCKKKTANVHFSGIINGKPVKVDLCETCAQNSGLTLNLIDTTLGHFAGPFFSFPSLSPILADLMNILSQWSKKETLVSPRACPQCRWTLRQFQRFGKMGCPECYMTFREEARNILKRIHGTTLHKGKKGTPLAAIPKPKSKEPREEPDEALSLLKARLEKAVKDERYEEAAKLRDKIRELEKKE
ncbi:MAG: UvrB/UvrC motif-containing protein [Elusimicrobia bacterium]|nr:UvrB/UvrC motif-containing protein [Candidatus Obscuribacterium magneticum]